MDIVISQVLEFSPLFGVGAAGWAVPYDSGLTEVIVINGAFGVALHVVVLAAILRFGFTSLDPDRRMFTILFSLLLIGGDLGVPALTSNRNATVVWVLFSLLVLANASGARRLSTSATLPEAVANTAPSAARPGARRATQEREHG